VLVRVLAGSDHRFELDALKDGLSLLAKGHVDLRCAVASLRLAGHVARMPRFYFDIISPTDLRVDGEGDEFDSVAEARAQVSWFAEKIAGNMVDGATEVELRDEAGAVLATEMLPTKTIITEH
jgi:hypothetical protein